MSSSTYATYQSLLDNGSKDRMHPSYNDGTFDHSQPPSSTPFASNHLSPYGQIHSNAVSTPADSLSAFSEQYQSSDFSEVDADADPFLGVDFNTDGGTPSFLDERLPSSELSSDHSEAGSQPFTNNQTQNAFDWQAYPLSPDATNPSTHTSPPGAEYRSSNYHNRPLPDSASPQVLSKSPKSIFVNTSLIHEVPRPGPDTNSSGRSSEDSMDPSTTSVSGPSPSPRVTVSMWAKDQIHNIDSAFPENPEVSVPVRPGISADDNFIVPSYQGTYTSRDAQGAWFPDSRTGQRGLGPEHRPVDEVTNTVNELDSRREVVERNDQVGDWVLRTESSVSHDAPPAPPVSTNGPEGDGISPREIATGDQTENKPLPGQTYYVETGGAITEEDLEIMRQNRLWSDAPMMYAISKKGTIRNQPETSQNAIQQFERMCRDNDSVVSRAATWGTRRRSLPSISDIDGITSGNFLKKLSINRDRKPSIFFKELRGLVRRPSASQMKRSRTSQDEEGSSDADTNNRRESQSSLNLAPPCRTTSWGKKQQTPSLNTALMSMATGAAVIGTQHARTSSISNVTSPKSPSPFNLQVKNTLRRPRSKSDLPRGSTDESHPNLVHMWKKSGGPPVAQLSKGVVADRSEDEDDDDDLYEESDMKRDVNKMIDVITPNFAGFQQHVLKMNPKLAEQNNYLVDRIAHQQIVRYKNLLHNKVRHLQHISNRNCPCGPMCIALGGSATIMDVKGDTRGVDPLSTRYDESDGDMMPLEGAITTESFPADIPMPPTNTLPAEFECQLCYQAKKFTKPSDWTKHVHEDVQPFTCTWDRCRDPKIFKRKADWVRHENEGHRHLEWWTCDVDDCRHTCYRRDNFLQHLVREHKFPEPKVKTKAAIKRAGGSEPTWQKVEKCREETRVRPQDEPCHFCGKTFPTWKKLTVHLAKHMESLSLPILRLVARKELESDTIISPVQDLPPRTFAPLPPTKNEQESFSRSPSVTQNPMQQQPGVIAYSHAQDSYAYQTPAPAQNQGAFHNPFYGSAMQGLPHLDTMPLGVHQGVSSTGFHSQPSYQNFPVSTGSYIPPSNQYIAIPQRQQNLEPFPALQIDPLGLQDPSGNQMYNGLMDPVSTGGEHYTPRGSVSPYSQSPHQGQGGFYSHQ